MRYVSAYRKSHSYQALFRWLQIGMLLLPVAIIFLGLQFETDPAERRELQVAWPWIVLGGIATVAIIRYSFKRKSDLVVEIDERAIQHIAPGQPKTLLWADITNARVVAVNKHERAVRVKTKTARYILQSHLVPDTYDAPDLRLGFPKPRWHHPDGRTEPADIEHSYGWRLVQQYRPDLLKNGKIARGL